MTTVGRHNTLSRSAVAGLMVPDSIGNEHHIRRGRRGQECQVACGHVLLAPKLFNRA